MPGRHRLGLGLRAGRRRVDITPPALYADAATVAPGEAVIVPVLANDAGAALVNTVRIARQGAKGSAAVLPDGTIRYTALAGQTGTDGFTYEAFDAAGNGASAEVTITIVA